MGDKLNKLPSTRGVSHDSPEDIELLTSIFGSPQNLNIDKVCSSNKDIIVACALFLIINLPIFTTIIQKLYKNSENPWVMVMVKTVIFGFFLFFMTNSKLAFKS